MKATRAGLEEAKKRWQQKKDRQTMQDEQETKSRHHAYVSQDVGHQSSSSYNESALFNLESMPSHISDNDKAAQEVGGWGMLVGGQEEFALHGLKNKSSSRRSNKVDKYEHLASLEESISQSEKELQMLRKRVTSVKPNHPLAEALDLKENSEAEDESFDDEDLLRDSDMYEKDGDYLLVNETDNEVVSSISNIQMVEELCSASQLKEGLPYQVVLDEHWGPSKEDSDLLSYEAGRRCFSSNLLHRLIGDMPLEVQIIDCNESDANILERFHECPDVYIVGPKKYQVKLASSLPRGFRLIFVDKHKTVLTRVPSPSPPPLDSSDSKSDSGEPEHEMESKLIRSTRTADAMYKKGKLGREEYLQRMERGMKRLENLAESGSSVACRELGQRLINGNRTHQDVVDGCRFLMKAAASGDCECQTAIARYYELGVGLPRNDKMAFAWYKLAANGNVKFPEGILEAKHNLAVCYQEGQGCKRDIVLACKWFKIAAKQGLLESQYNLALLYSIGLGVRRHNKKAAYWFLQAAKSGCVHSQLQIGIRYWSGIGVTENRSSAVLWFRKAAKSSEEAKKILDSITSGVDVTEYVRSLFPKPQESKATEDFVKTYEDVRHELAQQLNASLRHSEHVQRRMEQSGPTLSNLLKGRRMGKRFAQSLGDAQLEAFETLAHEGIEVRGTPKDQSRKKVRGKPRR